MKKILLDTNFLLAPVQFKADIYEQITADFFTLDACIEELEKIAKRKTKPGVQAKAALILAKTKGVKILEAKKKNVDEALAEAAKQHNYIVATNDRKLITKLKAGGIGIVRLRQRKLVVKE